MAKDKLVKYLYGKSEYLTPFINGEVSLRFSDLSHYSRLENEIMRDVELLKIFEIDPSDCVITINNYKLNDFVGNIKLDIPVDNCYCLCLSDKKNDVSLFERFKADTCLEIDIHKLIEVFESLFLKKFIGTTIEHGAVTYYKVTDIIPENHLHNLVFYKLDLFEIENEYRVVIRFPKERKKFKTVEGLNIPIFADGESMHLTMTTEDKKTNNYYLNNVFYSDQI